MQALDQWFQMIIQSISHGAGPYLATTFLVVVMTPMLLDILFSIVGVKLNLTDKALKFWSKWFVSWPVKTAWNGLKYLLNALWSAIVPKKTQRRRRRRRR